MTSATDWRRSPRGNLVAGNENLRVTIFKNHRSGGWSIAVNRRDAPAQFLNFATESAAIAHAEMLLE
ncbi:MAG TPA: hypothetical protein VEK14_04680, partial [Rhodomicrobium sp.]|nr:hypothetical protein [Rhodomicrobium sp.]